MRARSLLIPSWLLVLTQCGGEGPERVIRHPLITVPKAAPEPLPGLPAFVVAEVPSGTQGPVVTSRDDKALVAWAESAENVWRFRAAAIVPQVAKVAPVIEVGAAPENLELLFLRYLDDSGAILAYTHVDTNGGHRFSAMLLDDQGRARSEPVLLSVSSEALLWIDVVSTPKGPLVFWASSRSDRADVRSAALNREGAIRAAAHDVMSDLRAWQVAPSAKGAALATVRAIANKPNGPVSLTFLDDTGMPVDRSIAVTNSESAELDIDVAAIGDNFVVAWTDRQAGDSRLYAAAVSQTGQMAAPAHPLTAPLGDQSLVKLTVSPKSKRGYLLWENLLAPDPIRRLQAASIDEKSQLSNNRVSIAYPGASDRSPEVSASSQGFSLITQIPVATLRQSAAAARLDLSFDNEEPTTVPTLVSLTDTMEVKCVAPMLLASKPIVPNLVWGLHCGKGDCFALAALSGEARAAVLGTRISQSSKASRSFVAQSEAKVAVGLAGYDAADAKLRAFLVSPGDSTKRPRLAAVRVVSESEPLADFGVTNTVDVPLVATLTYFDPESKVEPLKGPAEDGRREPLQARIDLRGPLGETAESRGFVSLRARSAGGF